MAKTIFVATDLTPAARACYAHAATWAHALEADVVLVHADEHVAGGFFQGAALDAYLNATKGLRTTRLREARADLHAQGVRVSVDLRPVASPADAVFDAVYQYGADLVVMGRQGTHPILDRLFGSTTARLLAGLEVPALVVPAGPDATDFPGGLRPARYRRMLCGCELTGLSAAVAGEAADLARRFGASLSILSAQPMTDTAVAAPGTEQLPAGLMAGEHQARAASQALARLRQRVGEGLEVETVIAHGAPKRAILEACAQHDIDLVALGAARGPISRARHRTVARWVALRAPTAVLVYPEQALGARRAEAA